MTSRSRRIATWLLVAVAPIAAGAVCAQPYQQIDVTLGVSELPGLTGNRVTVDWMHRSSQRGIHAGLERRRVGSVDWQLLEVGGVWTSARGLNVGGAVESDLDGKGTERYRRAQASIGYRVADRWSVTVDETYFRVDPVEGRAASVTLDRIWSSALSTSLRLSRSHSGNLDDASLAGRLVYRALPPHLIAGFAVGASNNRLLLDIPRHQATETDYRQGFLGLSGPIGKTVASIVLETAKLGELRRLGLTFSVTWRPAGGE